MAGIGLARLFNRNSLIEILNRAYRCGGSAGFEAPQLELGLHTSFPFNLPSHDGR